MYIDHLQRLVVEASPDAVWGSEPERYHDLTGKVFTRRVPVTLVPFYDQSPILGISFANPFYRVVVDLASLISFAT